MQTQKDKKNMLESVDAALSHYLAFRYLPSPFLQWAPGVRPEPAVPRESERQLVQGPDDFVTALQAILQTEGDYAILLSGGIDSAILAALAPAGTLCLTIDFGGEADNDEVTWARAYADAKGHEHKVVSVSWESYDRGLDDLFALKRSPFHAIEPALYQAGLAASASGVHRVIVGNGADSSFGGMDKLMTHSPDISAFQQRYEFVDPSVALTNPVSTRWLFEAFQLSNGELDIARFLREAHGSGIVRSFVEPLGWAGVECVAPYEKLGPSVPVTAAMIKAEGPKPMLREVFSSLYPSLDARPKVPFVRPTDAWLADWTGPSDPHFASGWTPTTGESKWLAYCAERFLAWLERD